MARDIQVFDVTIPRGGSAAAPQVFSLAMPPRVVQQVELMLPSGLRGQLHVALAMVGTRIIPSNDTAYITGDGEVIRWPVEGHPDSGAWQLLAYNSGGFPHTIQIRFLLGLVQPASSPGPALLPAAALSSG